MGNRSKCTVGFKRRVDPGSDFKCAFSAQIVYEASTKDMAGKRSRLSVFLCSCFNKNTRYAKKYALRPTREADGKV